jgi:hypothetical protein
MRDQNIKLSLSREINMRQRSVRDRTKYSRKEKHSKGWN